MPTQNVRVQEAPLVEVADHLAFNCPVCGQSVFDEEIGFDSPRCPHIKMMFTDAVCDFFFVADGMADIVQEVLKSIETAQDEDNDETIDSIMFACAEKYGMKVYGWTQNGQACGPCEINDYFFIKE